MIVCKFGGTSIQDAPRIENALNIVAERIAEQPILVASAIGNTTDLLDQVVRYAQKGTPDDCLKIINQLQTRHLDVASHIRHHAQIWHQVCGRIETHIQYIQEQASMLLNRTHNMPKSDKIAASILACGELLSNSIIYAFAHARAIDVTLVDSRTIIVTNSNYLSAVPKIEATFARVKNAIHPQNNHLYIAPGYISANQKGETTTLGRGGSDFTAALIGAAVDATVVEIWTDVNGVMTSDPNVVPNARTIPVISYNEAAELAYFGARVIHPSTILPAIQKNIPLLVRNSMRPDLKGTTIAPTTSSDQGVRAIAQKNNITIITMQSYRMLNAYGFLSTIFSVFKNHHIPVDIVTTSEVSVSVSVESHLTISDLQMELAQFCNVEVEENYSIICVVGQGLWKDSLTIAKTFRVLQNIPIRLISLGSSDTNLTLVVPTAHASSAVHLLHKEYFE